MAAPLHKPISTGAPSEARRLLARIAPAQAVEVLSPDEVRTERLLLRPLRESDRIAFVELVRTSQARVSTWFPLMTRDETVEDYVERELATVTRCNADGTAWRRIAQLDDGRLAGVFNLNCIQRGLEWDADAAWWIGDGHARQGFAREGAGAMLEFALADLPNGLGLHSVHAGVAPENEAGRRLVESLGFVRNEGRRSKLRVGEAWHTHDEYVLRPSVTDQF